MLRDLNRYANECIDDMKALGIDVPHIDKFVVNSRAKSRYGQCSYNYKTKTYTIEICSDLVDDECNIMALRETIFHELIHTLPNCMNHGEEFKRYAKIINDRYGTNIKRCSTDVEKYGYIYSKKVAERREKSRKPETTYELFCERCGKIRASKTCRRMPKWYAHTEQYHCSVCKGKLERVTGSYSLMSANMRG